MLYLLFRDHHWPLSELRGLWEDRSGWQEVIRTFTALEAEHRTGE